MKRSVTVTIAGHRLVLRSDGDDDTVQKLAAEVDKRIKAIVKGGRAFDTQQVAMLVALQFAEEAHLEREAGRALKKQVRERSRALLRLLGREARV